MLQEIIEKNLLKKYYTVEEIYLSETFVFQKLDKNQLVGIPITIVSEKVLTHISAVKSPQGCLAVIKYQQFQLTDIMSDIIHRINDSHTKTINNNLIIMLDAIQDPGNMGTIIRIADAVNAKALILGDGCVDVYSDKVVRSAMGSLFHIPIIQSDLIGACKYLHNQGYRIVAADLHGVDYRNNLNYHNISLILGNEANGVSANLKDWINSYISISMPGNAESLNVAVATGIISFDILRQWQC